MTRTKTCWSCGCAYHGKHMGVSFAWRGIASLMGYEPRGHNGVKPSSPWILERIRRYRQLVAEEELQKSSPVLMDVLRERARQGEERRYGEGRDLVDAAVTYALAAAYPELTSHWWRQFWPWRRNLWNPESPRRNLVRAAALLITQIEKLDREEGEG